MIYPRLEEMAARAEEAHEGGNWRSDFTEPQRDWWRQFVKDLLAMVRESDLGWQPIETAAEIERLRADKASRDLWAIAAVTQFDDIAEAVTAEREACAILADERGAVTVAAAIRARGDNS